MAGLGLLAAGALTLTACAPAKAGAAAIVGDHRISMQEVNEASAGIREGNPTLSEGTGLERTVVYYLVLSPFVLPVAEANGQGVSEEEAAKLLPKTTEPDQTSILVLRTFIALQKLQQAGASQALSQVQKDVTAAAPTVSPRYGTFDTSQMVIVDKAPNWVVPNSEPTPTTGAQP